MMGNKAVGPIWEANRPGYRVHPAPAERPLAQLETRFALSRRPPALSETQLAPTGWWLAAFWP